MVIGGFKLANKYEGGKLQDLARYSPQLIKSITKRHKEFKKEKGGYLSR